MERQVYTFQGSLSNADVNEGTAIAWAAAGASTIVITGRNEQSLQSTAEALRKLSPTVKVLAIPCDVTDQQSVASLFSKVKSELENLDVLICNVGGMSHPGAHLKLGEMKPEDWMGDYVSLSFFTLNST